MKPISKPAFYFCPRLTGFAVYSFGFMFAPMTGLLLSEMIMGEKTSLDIEELHIDRFKNSNTTTYERNVV